jgi:hypothetical protein
MRSMSAGGQRGGDGGDIPIYSVRVMFSLRMSSSLATLSISFRLSSSTTRTFHCEKNQQSSVGGVRVRSAGARTSPRVVLRMVLMMTGCGLAMFAVVTSGKGEVIRSCCMSMIETPMMAGRGGGSLAGRRFRGWCASRARSTGEIFRGGGHLVDSRSSRVQHSQRWIMYSVDVVLVRSIHVGNPPAGPAWSCPWSG